jgi:hypothetical protein
MQIALTAIMMAWVASCQSVKENVVVIVHIQMVIVKLPSWNQ